MWTEKHMSHAVFAMLYCLPVDEMTLRIIQGRWH